MSTKCEKSGKDHLGTSCTVTGSDWERCAVTGSAVLTFRVCGVCGGVSHVLPVTVQLVPKWSFPLLATFLVGLGLESDGNGEMFPE